MKRKHLYWMVLTAVCLVPIMVLGKNLTDEELTFFNKKTLHPPLLVSTSMTAPFNQDRVTYSHEGVDVSVPLYTPVYAISDGVVTKAAPDSKGVQEGGGNMVFIDHGDGTQSWYMHLAAYGVQEGDRVKAGDVIALSGQTGRVTGPHLHFEYRVKGVPINPYFILESFGLFD